MSQNNDPIHRENRSDSYSKHRKILSDKSMTSYTDETTFKEIADEEEKLLLKLSSSNNLNNDNDNSYNTNNRFDSFVEKRDGCHAYWFIDGKDYFSHLADSLEKAEFEIFITDWSLNPEIFLRRENGKENAKDRLDTILLRKAKKGVMIYVLVWYETHQAMAGSVNSVHTIKTLESLHSNIRVLRHPGGKTKLYWSHHQKTVIIDQKYAYLGGVDLCFGRYDKQSHPLIDDCYLAPEFPGKDYYNPYYQDFISLDKPFIDLIDRTTIPRMPWHDIHCYVDREAARDVGLNFIERWNHHLNKKLAGGDSRVRNYPKLTLSNSPFLDSLFPRGSISCQIIRSICTWSGASRKEMSIQNAYLDLIQNAEHYIYVENQYFISVENALTETLFQRISQAIRFQQTFRVYIVIPVHPCGDWKVPSIKFVLKWQYDTISRGGYSLLERLSKTFPSVDLNNYISFYSLRNVGVLSGECVTEQVYIHSKLIIVDDRRVIIGSANWNDRSMNGDRDSEIAILVEDNRFVTSTMNGEFYLASKFAFTLRRDLFIEHLGLTKEDRHLIIDPVCDDVYINLWKTYANDNSHLYQSMFPTLPSNNILTTTQFYEYESTLNKIDVERTTNLQTMTKIRGHVIPFPVDFLKNEKLDAGLVIEKWLSSKIFQ